MGLTLQEYGALVNRLEQQARAHPTLYRVRAWLLVALGVIIIPLVLLVALLLCVLAVPSLILGGFGGIILGIALRNFFEQVRAAYRAVFVRLYLQTPDGLEVRRDEAPQLFSAIDEISARMRAPRAHVILIAGDFNAALAQRPRLGPFGWQRNYLVLGLPLMMALSTEHFRSVIAHELGHLSGQHGRFSVWLLRVRATLQRFQEELERDDNVRFGLTAFFRWYLPMLSPFAFVLGRLDEIEADLRGADVCGRLVYARAYLRLHLMGLFTETRFWPSLRELADEQMAPPTDAYARMMARLKTGITAEEETELVQKSIEEATSFFDPHLAFCERLAMLGYPAILGDGEPKLHYELRRVPPPEVSAAETYLGAALPGLLKELSQAWWLRNLSRWAERYTNVQESREGLAKLPVDPVASVQTPQQGMDYAEMALHAGGPEAALPFVSQVLVLDPNHTQAHYVMGQILLAQQDEQGLGHLRFVMEHDVPRALDAAKKAHEYLVKAGKLAMADEYGAWAKRFMARLDDAKAERNRLSPEDRFLTPDWSAEELGTLQQQLRGVPGVGLAYLVRRAVRHLPQAPCYLLAIIPAYRVWPGVLPVPDETMIQQAYAAVKTERELVIIALTGQLQMVEPAITAIHNAYIFQAGM